MRAYLSWPAVGVGFALMLAGAVAGSGGAAESISSAVGAEAATVRGFEAELSSEVALRRHSFYFSRAMYGGGGMGGRSRWATDYPQADHWFASVLGRLTGIDVFPSDNVLRLDDPQLRMFPFLYAVEVGSMGLSAAEIENLRGYLLAGGFLMVDDFWGSWQWSTFEQQMAQVLPEHPIVEVGLEHPLFSTFYQIDEVRQVPAVNRGISGGPTWEQDGYTPRVRGIFDEKGRMMVAINWNTDLGDAWEWAEEPRYPLSFSTYAYQVGANTVIYAMTR